MFVKYNSSQYVRVRGVLRSYKNVLSFSPICTECEKAVGQIAERLGEAFLDTRVKIQFALKFSMQHY